MSSARICITGACLGFALNVAFWSAGHAAPDAFTLGQSSRGDACDAQANDHDPAAQAKGGRAWTVACRGWDYALGDLYSFAGAKPSQAWRDKWASCSDETPVTLPGFASAKRMTCKAAVGGASYSVVLATTSRWPNSHGAFIAEGQAPIADLLERGVKTVAGLTVAEVQGTRTSGVVDFSNSASARRRTAYVLNQRWMYNDAEKDFAALAEDATASPAIRAEAYLNWGLNASDQARSGEAADHFAKGDALIATLHDPILAEQSFNYMAAAALNQDDDSKAIEMAQVVVKGEALTDLEAKYGARPASVGIDELTASKLNSGASLEGLQALTTKQRHVVMSAQAQYTIASAQWKRRDYPAANRALAEADEVFATALTDPGGTNIYRSTAWLRADMADLHARIALALNDKPEAVKQSKAALQILKDRPDLLGYPVAARFFIDIAETEKAAGALEAALSDYQEGVSLFLATRGSLGDSGDAAALYFRTLMDKIESDPTHAAEFKNTFFEAMQSVKAQTIADTMKRSFAGAAGSEQASHQARQFEDARREKGLAESELRRLQNSSATSDDIAAAQRNVATRTADALAMQQKLVESNPRYGGLVSRAASIEDLQKSLQPGEIYVKTLLLEEQGFGVAITRDDATVYTIDRPKSQIQTDVQHLRHPFDGGSVGFFDVEGAHALYKTVFGPATDRVSVSQHLIYEPDGALISLPAEVYVVDDKSVADFVAQRTRAAASDYNLDFRDTAWLGRKTDISLEVSASGFINARKAAPSKAPKAFLGFGDPHTKGVKDQRLFSLLTTQTAGDCELVRATMAARLPELPKTADQVRKIGKLMGANPQDLVVGDTFTDTEVERRGDPLHGDMQQYRVIYFGTHGLLPTDGACLREPVLVTSLGDSPSGALLSVSKIVGLNMDADLVVLSACDTGKGADGVAEHTGLASSGAGLDGMAQAFIFAGARNLIVSHWEVDADATDTLMSALFESPAKTSEAGALRRAQLALMADEKRAHPYYWAAFSLVGDGQHALPGRQ